MSSTSAIALFGNPFATNRTISRSRGLNEMQALPVAGTAGAGR